MGYLKEDYNVEKETFKKLLKGTRMCEISYNETFNLIFHTNIRDEVKNTWISRQLILIIDAPYWFGDKSEWDIRVEKGKSKQQVFELEDCLLAFELVKMRSCNLIQVEAVEFMDEFVEIVFEGGKSLSITFYAESDYSWILEDYQNKDNKTRLMVLCQGNELYMKNIPDIL